jgi:hypothetical protein
MACEILSAALSNGYQAALRAVLCSTVRRAAENNAEIGWIVKLVQRKNRPLAKYLEQSYVKVRQSIRKKREAAWKHGITRYIRLGCRCGICKEAKRMSQQSYQKRYPLKQAERNKKYRDRPLELKNLTHGTYSTHTVGCRCSKCLKAGTIHNRDYYKKTREKPHKQEAA